MEKICVAIRVRPSTSDDISSSTGLHWKVQDNRISLHKRLGTPISGLSYSFDQIFDENSANSMVYELLTKDIVHAAVDGFNGTVFAYGQTSSGKTFTMNGSLTDPGVIHRAVRDIFLKIQEETEREFLVRVSYMEIYNEEINDLFAVDNKKLQIHESLERGIYVSGLKEEIVSTADHVLQLIESGEVNRHFGETNMNVRSSRSHTIFRMVIESRGKNLNHHDEYLRGDAVRVSVLNLVDLAGSERIAKTGAAGVRLKEGKHINKSLMVLGNVINKLREGVKQRGHIPYRDSKLTRILQPALGGNAKTSIICTVAPEEIHVEETKGTLQFASRAKRITNCAQVNEILTDSALLKRQKLEIEELRQKLQGSRAEVLEQEILKLRNDMLKYELERERLASELEEERKSHKEREKQHGMKLGNVNSQVNLSDCHISSSQEHEPHKQNYNDESTVKHQKYQEETFRTPCFKAAPSAFVAKRGKFSKLPDFSPLPNTLSDMADEDTWQKLNKGYVADLEVKAKKGTLSIRSPPSEHQENQLLLLPCPAGIPYPFDAQPIFRNVRERKRFDKFSDYEVLAPIFPDFDALKSLDLFDEVLHYFDTCGFGILFKEDPGTYPALVREFVSNFVPTWECGAINELIEGRKDRFATKWNFRLGGKDHMLMDVDIRRILGVEHHGKFPALTRKTRNEFWRMITESDEDYVPSKPASLIRVTIWKVVHRLIATCIYARKDKGRFVNKDDLNLMYYFKNLTFVDVVGVLAKHFEVYQSSKYKSKALGGGPFITLIAKDLGFVLDSNHSLPKSVLTRDSMVRMQMLDSDGNQRKVKEALPARNKKRKVGGNSKASSSSAGAPAPPTETHGFAEMNSVDALSSSLENLASFTYAYAAWHGDMMSNLFTHMGWSGYRPPPQPMPFQNPPTHQGFNYSGGGNEEEDDQDAWESGTTPDEDDDAEMDLYEDDETD